MRGFSTISFVVASAVIAISSIAVFQGISQNSSTYFTYQRKSVGDNLASESLEFFASMNADRLNTYLKNDPMNPGTAGANYHYPLCAEINLLNRASNFLSNPDPVMNLPLSLLSVGAAEAAPNRYYQVRVVQLIPDKPYIVIKQSACQTATPPPYTPYVFADASERFMVTVGLNWVSPGRDIASAETTKLSTLIAELSAPPSVDITANGQQGPISIPSGTAATIAWTSADAVSCMITPSGWTGTSGSQSSGNLNADITYTATCTNATGVTVSDDVTITVIPVVPMPTVDITANGQQGPISIPSGTSATIAWTSMNAVSCTIAPTLWSGTSGSQSSGNLSASVTYTATCTNTAGVTATDQVTVSAADPCDPNDPNGLITFEKLPDGSNVTSTTQITTQYQFSHGITFCRETSPGVCDPVNITQYGNAGGPAQFMCDSSIPGCTFPPDVVGMPRVGQAINFGNHGTYGTGPDAMGNLSPNKTPPIYINYLQPSANASGILGDIDDGEYITIQALDINGAIIDQRVFADGDPGTGNGIGTFWQFDFGINKVMHKIRLLSTGSGFGIDNFSPSKLCASPPLVCPYNGAFNPGIGFNNSVAHVEPVLGTGSCLGDLVLVGDFTSYNGDPANHIVRIHADGSRDTTFAIGNGFDADAGEATFDPNGSGAIYVIGGFDSYNGQSVAHGIVKLNRDGSLDTTFNSNAGSGFNVAPWTIYSTIDGTGDVLVGGQFTSYRGSGTPGLIRIRPNGTRASTFNPGAFTGVNALLFMGNSVYVTAYPSRIAKLNATTGAADSAFSGSFSGALNSGSSYPTALEPARDGTGDIFVGGNFTQYNKGGANTARGVARLRPNGDFAGSFNTGATGFNGMVHHLETMDNGTIHVSGEFTSYQSVSAGHVARLLPNGARDTSFNVGPSGLNNTVHCGTRFEGIPSTSIYSSYVYSVGDFTNYNGISASRIIRLGPTGLPQ